MATVNPDKMIDADKEMAEWGRHEAAWFQQEAERRARSLEAGLKILEAGLQMDILRRNAPAAAGRILNMTRLKHPDHLEDCLSLLAITYAEWFDRGRDRGLPFDIEVASEIAAKGLELAITEEQQEFWQKFIDQARA